MGLLKGFLLISAWILASGGNATDRVGTNTKIRTCIDCPEFVSLPTFSISGRNISHVSRYELTWKNYLQSYFARACSLPKLSVRKDFGQPSEAEIQSLALDWPIGVLTLEQIDCYSKWLGKRLGVELALPTSDEWSAIDQPSASSVDTSPSSALETRSSPDWKLPIYTIVFDNIRDKHIGSSAPNRMGIFDLHGSFRELTSTCDEKGRLGELNLTRCITRSGGDSAANEGIRYALIIEGSPSIDAGIRLVVLAKNR
ncbi:SUMF1/EgtB/PvdO family nonheme iron enzyme [Sphingomonas oleivorans]|uniref:SUMF1/EgtB/PvdO family nonheme iron enzyme n=1 Tax=Sphingomonas oleivorans TaxID=1735121 RepID=UPI0013FDFE49|nr:SUMF1/EgtB/PvdO family nonheme iron enzyme [Sphingomonas oleivorans]